MSTFYKFKSTKIANDYESLIRDIYFAPLHILNDPFEGKFSLNQSNSNQEREVSNRLSRRLVCCLSGNSDNPHFIEDNHLMWTHYADQHRGICIEYDESILNGFSHYTKVKNIQQDVWGEIKYVGSMHDSITNGDDLDRGCADILFSKHFHFKGENEIRIVRHVTLNDINETHQIKNVVSSIKAIYLGVRISDEDKLAIINLAKKLNVKCYQMSLKSCSYELQYDVITEDNLRYVDPITCRLINR